MTARLIVAAAWLVAGLAAARVDAADLYEWHTLASPPAKLADLHARLRDRVLPAIATHGLRTVGVFTPAGENPDGVVHLIVAGDDVGRPAAEGGLLANLAEWRAVLDGGGDLPAVATARGDLRLRTTTWSPLPAAGAAPTPRAFELRTYTSPDAAKRTALLRRFEQHTMKLFARHGMTNVIYWIPDGGPDADTRLVYLLAHDTADAAKASFDAFRKDPDWIAAKTASEAAAGGSLTAREQGVVSEFLRPTDYSPLR